ncbi:cell wall-binding repeat-containing protein [Ornithinimicrobium ciconiae]|uniref:cell wall-binding repeat-containing protein n=1 Tax=Ornithinimicrobium ciconiae TaxID=2594265 RepID=UPI0013FCF820|nr:cell wall-binding repeat-containing protein [Ornithinimicrobium ciconiae]
MSSSALAGSEDVPVLITRQDKLPNSIVAELNRLSPERVVIVGGTGAVSQGVEDRLNELYPGWIG